jgi:hypothetical protein
MEVSFWFMSTVKFVELLASHSGMPASCSNHSCERPSVDIRIGRETVGVACMLTHALSLCFRSTLFTYISTFFLAVWLVWHCLLALWLLTTQKIKELHYSLWIREDGKEYTGSWSYMHLLCEKKSMNMVTFCYCTHCFINEVLRVL